MATTSSKRHKKLPTELAEAVASGELSREQVMELLSLRAARLGLTARAALERARRNELPYDALGLEIRGLTFLLGERQSMLHAPLFAESDSDQIPRVQLPEGEDDGRPRLPDELIEAIEGGVLTNDQLRELIAFEAAQLGLSYDEAVLRAQNDDLPHTPIGLDLRDLVYMLTR